MLILFDDVHWLFMLLAGRFRRTARSWYHAELLKILHKEWISAVEQHSHGFYERVSMREHASWRCLLEQKRTAAMVHLKPQRKKTAQSDMI